MKVSTKEKKPSKMDILLKYVEELTRRVDALEYKVGIGWKHEFLPSVDYPTDYDPENNKPKYNYPVDNSIKI